MDNFLIEWSSASVLLLIEKLTEKKPVVTEKYELDSRDEPIMLALFGKPALSRFWWNDQTEKCFKQIALNKYVGFDGQLRGWTQARSYGDFWVRTWRQFKIFIISWPFWTIRNLIEGAKLRVFQRIPLYKPTVLSWDLGEWTEPCVLGEERMATPTKLKTDWGFWHSLNVAIIDRYVITEIFSRRILFFDPGETKLAKKLIKKTGKEALLFTLVFEFFDRFIHFTFFLFCLKKQKFFRKSWKTICVVYFKNGSFLRKKSKPINEP